MRASPKWWKNAQTNHSVEFSHSASSKTLCPIFPISYDSLFSQTAHCAQPIKTNLFEWKQTLKENDSELPNQKVYSNSKLPNWINGSRKTGTNLIISTENGPSYFRGKPRPQPALESYTGITVESGTSTEDWYPKVKSRYCIVSERKWKDAITIFLFAYLSECLDIQQWPADDPPPFDSQHSVFQVFILCLLIT